jgi:hypothetical protein
MTVRTKTVLLVDDSATARIDRVAPPETKVYRLLEANDGAEAWRWSDPKTKPSHHD